MASVGLTDGSVVNAVRQTVRGRFVTVERNSGFIQLWSALNDGDWLPASRITIADSVCFAMFAANGQLLVVALDGECGAVKFMDVRTCQCQNTVKHGAPVEYAVVSEDSSLVMTASDELVKIWTVLLAECCLILSIQVHAAIFTDMGQTLLVAQDNGCGGMVCFFNTESGEGMDQFSPEDEDLWDGMRRIDSAAFSRDGSLVAFMPRNGDVSIWNVIDRSLVLDLSDQGVGAYSWSVTFSPDSRILVTTCQDRTAKLWDIATGRCLQTFDVCPGPVHDHRPDGVQSAVFVGSSCQLFATAPYPCEEGGEPCIIRFWDVDSGECTKDISVPQPLMNLSFWSVCPSGVPY